MRWVDGWEGIGTSKRIKGLSKTRSGFPIGPPLFSNGSYRRWRRLATATRLFLLLFFFCSFSLGMPKKERDCDDDFFSRWAFLPGEKEEGAAVGHAR